MGIVYGTSNLLLKSALRVFGDWQVEGRHNVPRNGRVIIVSNHLSDIDPGILNVSIPRRVQFMAKAELFDNPLLGQLFRAYGAFPINENGKEFYSINHSLRILNREGAMGIFPEGAKNPTALGRAMLGTAVIAMRSRAPVVPVGITGTESVVNWLGYCHPKGNFKITIGKPFFVQEPATRRIRKDLESVTDIIMKHIAELLPERYRGVYHDLWQGERSYTSPPNWLDEHFGNMSL